jgi:hypothetical protein
MIIRFFVVFSFVGTVEVTIQEVDPLIHLVRTTRIKADPVVFSRLSLDATRFYLKSATVSVQSKGTVQGCNEIFGPSKATVRVDHLDDPQRYGFIQLTQWWDPWSDQWSGWGGNTQVSGTRSIQCQSAPASSIVDTLNLTWLNVSKRSFTWIPFIFETKHGPVQASAPDKQTLDYMDADARRAMSEWSQYTRVRSAASGYYRKTTYRWNLVAK